MKKLSLSLLSFCIAALFMFSVQAQQKISLADVKEIILDSGQGFALRGGNNTEFEVLNEQGRWNSYYTKHDVTDLRQPAQDVHTTDRTKVGILATLQVADFLNCLAVIKPEFDLIANNITPAILINEIKKTAKDTADNTVKLEDLITDASIKKALSYAMKDASVDSHFYRRIRIVKTNNDTLEMETSNSYATMLPWTFNHAQTYDMGINDFFIAAMCGSNYISTDMLTLRRLKEDIYVFIDANNNNHTIRNYRWKYCFTDNLKLLNDYFNSVKGDSAGWFNFNTLKLKTKVMAANMQLFGTVDLYDRLSILSLIDYSKQVDKYLKQNNFALNYYSAQPRYKINFSYSYFWKNAPNAYVSEAMQNYPSLKDINTSQAMTFSVSVPGRLMIDWFLVLPDNRVVLRRSYLNTPGPFRPVFPPGEPNVNGLNTTLRYVLFDANGKAVKDQ